jgi:prepilin-type N-terminal cleavage/methylation domain-containing protein
MENERGFTLIELLVVLAILATLFGITALALTGITSNAEEDLATTELDTVHTALDVCAVQSSCTNSTTSTTCEQVGPASGGANGFGNYLRRSSTFYYHWDSNGVITQDTEAGCTGTQYYP